MIAPEPLRSGQDLALRLQAAFPQQDWVALLAARAGESRDFVEWHLQEEAPPPAVLLRAAAALLGEGGRDGRTQP